MDTPVTYTFKFISLMTTPSGSYVSITFPSDVTLPSGSSAVTGCSYSSDGSTYSSLAGVTMTATSPPTVKITDAFSSS